MSRFGLRCAMIVLFSFIILSGTSNAAAKKQEKPIESFKKESENIQREDSKISLSTQNVESVRLDNVKDREIVLRLKQDADLNFSTYHVVNKQELNKKFSLVTVQVPDSYDYEKTLRKLKSLKEVVSAVPNHYYHTDFLPKDTYYKDNQKYLHLIGMEDAWNISRGSKEVKVAVIDTGVSENHPDLKGRLIEGYNATSPGSSPKDNAGHGTQVAGIIAANTNTRGITGIAPGISVLPIKTGKEDILSVDAIVKGIYYAIDKHVDIINMSFGGYESNEEIEAALWDAHKAGITLVASAGNDGSSTVEYPGAYPWVIAVGATDTRNGKFVKAGFSNYGGHLDLMAPGVELFSTSLDGSYDFKSGTSFSAPVVSGLAALIKTKHKDWTPSQVEFALEYGTDSMSKQEFNNETGFGEVNGEKAVSASLKNIGEDRAGFSLNSAELMTELPFSKEGLNFPNDQDLLKLEVKYTGKASVTVTHPASFMDLTVRLYEKKDGKLYKTLTSDQGLQGEPEQFTFDIKPGSYYLGISDYYGNWSKQKYKVEVQRQLDQPERLKGNSRYATAAAISKKGWDKGAEAVVLATGENFPDALSGSPLAYQLDAPILLTRTSYLVTEAKKEIERLKAKNVYILGGEGAVSEKVENTLENMGLSVTRISGTNRYETSAAIAEELLSMQGKDHFDKAIVSYGEKFPDALSSASYAARNGYPILLTEKDELPAETERMVRGVPETIVVGGEGVVSEEVVQELPNALRYAGTNRFASAAALLNGMQVTYQAAIVATGYNFADALTGSVLAAKLNEPILLVKKNEIPAEILNYIDNTGINKFTVLGGDGAVNQEVGAQLLERMN
ncbi:S8 family serine peptidase [Halobacillus salinarum]|uniref:S8 family serine peptidase n=1 Tax=Halobacillus salinarum TaxID=2932257 RepID=A0ABY4EHH2_9BACI|nr:cell wall-binding repeat-containing protein [Halobacillus salinarum]UOQ43913.1 S8 family serine peptidase [Halobacillus salinarum]